MRSTSYSSLERRLAALLDSAPRFRAFTKAAYQRANYLLRGWRRRPLRLHPEATIERVAGGERDQRGATAPAECFFGYFGMQPWSRDGFRQIFHRWRPPDARTVEICVRDRQSAAPGVIAESRAWNFQQGSMAQWLCLDGSESVVFNDVVDRRLACRIVGTEGRETVVPWPIQALHPGGGEALSINYRRLAFLRSEYGYDAPVENFASDQPLDRDGIWRVNLHSGEARLIVSLRNLVESAPREEMAGAGHMVNHAVYSPGGRQFVFMHRWQGTRGRFSRLYCARADGTELRMLLDDRLVSHYAWRDEGTLLVFARTREEGDRYYLLDVSTGARAALGAGTLDRFGDGHPSWSPNRRWILTDTYPDRARMRRLLLYDTAAGQLIEIGAFHSPWRYDGPVRCDLHPRWNPDGRQVSIDSAHEGLRATYVVDVSRLLPGTRPGTTAP